MKNKLKTSIYTFVWLALLAQNNLLALANSNSLSPNDTFGVTKANTTTNKLENQSLSEAIQTYINFIMTFLYLIAVAYALWGWFQILTAGWDDKKVTTWKTILIQWGLWLLVIWLSGTIVGWVLSALAS